MIIERIKRTPTRITDDKLVGYVTGILEGLTGNSFFPDAEDHLKPLREYYPLYADAIPSDSERNKVKKAAKEQHKSVVIKELARLALYVEYRADFNLEALHSSNFDLTSGKRQAKGIVGMLKNVQLNTNGEAGLLIVQCDPDPNAKMYKVHVSEDQESWTEFGASHTRKVKVKDLPVGKKLYIQMRAENHLGEGPWSASVMGVIPDPLVISSIHE